MRDAAMHDAGMVEPPRRGGRGPAWLPQRRATRVLAIVGLVLATLVVVAILGFHIITNTDWGRERVRRVLVSQLQDLASGGKVRIGRITGNLASGITAHDVTITDSAGAPFLAVDSLKARYRLMALVRRRIDLDDVVLQSPTIVLDRPPDGEWNWKRIFPGDTLPASRDTAPGFGDFLRFTDVTMIDGHVVVRSPWRPRGSLTGAQRDSAVQSVLAGGSRLMVVRVPGGFQKIVELRDIHATLPLVQLADPQVATRLIDVATMRTKALPFRPPAAEITDLRGRFHFTGDSLWWNDIAVRMPGSQLGGHGVYVLDNGDMTIQAKARPLAHADFRWLYPRLPARGGGPLDMQIVWKGATQDYIVNGADLRLDRQRVRGDIALRLDDDVTIRSSDLRVDNLDTRTIEQVVGGFDIPRRGTLDGRAKLRGDQTAMAVDAQLAFHDAQGTGTSEVAAVGEVGYIDRGRTGILRARNLRVRLLPLRLELAQAFAPGLPVGGTLRGNAVVNGATNTGVQVRGSLAHTEDGATSRASGVATVRVAGATHIDADVRLDPLAMTLVEKFAGDMPIAGAISGPVKFRGTVDDFVVSGDVAHADGGVVSRVAGRAAVERGRGTTFDADLRLAPLSLATVAAFAPSAGLRGSVSGPLRIRGSADDFVVRGTLAVAGGGTITGGGRIRPAGDRTAYDVDVVAAGFDASALSTKAPQSSITGRVVADGTGFAPATMRATVALNLDASSFEGASVDSAVGRVTIGDGLAVVERLQVRGQGLVADARGSFGLRRDRVGELAFNISAPSIAPFGRYIPGAGAEGEVAPRPGVVARRMASARADSARVARATEVERAITGAPAPRIVVDTPRAIPRGAAQGSLFAAGTARGNIHQFDARGRVAGENLAIRGHAAGRLRGEFAWVNARTPESRLSGAFSGADLQIAGFALDSADARVSYAAPSGRVAVALWQGPENDYALQGEFTMQPHGNELVARGVALRFDSTLYTAPRPFAIRWGGRGVEVDNLELVSSHGGRVFADGRLPVDGPANLAVAVTEFQVGDVLQLLQSDVNLRGLITAEGTMRGTLAAPRFQGAAALAAATLNGTSVPNLRGRFDYVNGVLASHLEAIRDTGSVLATVDARVPINLALSGVTGDRFSGEGLALDLVSDSLPLDLLPEVVDVVSNVSGRAAGRVNIRGSIRRPQITGAVTIVDAAARIDPLGIDVTSIGGVVRMAGDTVVIDSLIGRSDGTIRLRGGLGVGNFREPSFDLYLIADDAKVLDNDHGEMNLSAGLALRGPFRSPYLSGQATVEKGVLFAPSGAQKRLISTSDPAIYAVLDTTVRADRELLPGASSPLLRSLRADVDIVVNRNTWVRTRELNIEVFTEAPVSVHVENEEVAAVGIVNTDRGEYELLSKRFEVNRGSALFIGTPEINPTVQLTAGYEVRLPARPAINITIVVGGTMKAPRITLTSDAQPPIPQTELLSLLAFGTESSSLVAIAGSALSASGAGNPFTTGLAATRLFAVALGIAVEEAETEAGQALGVDVFNIRPADVPFFQGHPNWTDFFLGTEFEAGKYIDPQTFVAVEGVLPVRTRTVPPGIRLERRTPNGYRIELSYRPRFILQDPTLSEQERGTPIAGTGALGALLIREWRF